MIGQILVLACATFATTAGSCLDIQVQQPCASQVLSVPVSTSFSSPVCSEPVFSSGSSFSAPVFSPDSISVPSCSTPVVADNVFPSGCGVVSNNVFSTGSSFSVPVVSDNSFSTGILGSSCGSLNTVSAPVEIIPSGVGVPAIESPMISFSNSAVPAPRVISEKCICSKTVIKPQIIQRTVTVPKIQRYIKRTVTPVIENVAYKATPICQPESSVVFGSGIGSTEFLPSSAPVVVSSPSSVVVGTSCSSIPKCF